MSERKKQELQRDHRKKGSLLIEKVEKHCMDVVRK